ncbi:MAG: AI-2E family transporter [Pseudomonadota bacterium]|nr:AI-2E family transporter [Pseudomonadota bacterium]
MPSRLFAFGVTFGIAALMTYVLVTGRDLLIPFAIAVMIWYVIIALSRLIEVQLSAPSWLSLSASIIFFVVVLGLIVELISGNITAVRDAAPTYQANLEKLVESAMKLSGLTELPTIANIVDQVDVRALISGVAGAVAKVAGNTGLIVIYVIFLLAEQRTFPRKIEALFPEAGRRKEVQIILSDIQKRTQTYIAVKTLLSLVTAVISYVVLVAVGLDLAGFWAFVIFLLAYIPTIGSLLGVIFPALMALLQFGGISEFLIIAVGLGAAQLVIGNVLEPRMMGRSLNLSSLVVIVSLAVWGSLWGVTGMFLSVPITVVLMIILAQFKQTRSIAILLSANGKV